MCQCVKNALESVCLTRFTSKASSPHRTASAAGLYARQNIFFPLTDQFSRLNLRTSKFFRRSGGAYLWTVMKMRPCRCTTQRSCVSSLNRCCKNDRVIFFFGGYVYKQRDLKLEQTWCRGDCKRVRYWKLTTKLVDLVLNFQRGRESLCILKKNYVIENARYCNTYFNER